MRYLTAFGLATILATPVHASPIIDQFTSFWVLGDSLSDNGNTATMVSRLAAQQVPPIPLPGGSSLQQPGVSSDGFTWAREFTDAFAAAGKATANLSFGAARAGGNGSGPPDLDAQVAAGDSFTTSFELNEFLTLSGTTPKYPDGQGGLLDRQSDWGSTPLVTVFVGGNDFLDAAEAISNGADPTVTLPQVAQATFGAVQANIKALVGAGINDLVVMNVPDFSVIPLFNDDTTGLGTALSDTVVNYNSALGLYLYGLRATGVNVTSVDIYGALTDADRLAPLGLRDTQNACVLTPGVADCSGFLYFDNIHPTQNGHGLIADLTREGLVQTYDIQPVPLPAPALMLVTALGATMALRRRREKAA
ncbi:SGNH/GDSL hydrolase family protein [Roseobacter weihaiensis]|uniref:SGNH/GDSL hydrolase family protein n=1 Tax=Roseobacter weihaiensis TaxID=2763262 RepID=UPI001D0B904F|nr:SGNH/GDSL hydrolase family protein [Roseobacter sp. H9]